MMRVPTAAGLGVEIDRAAFERQVDLSAPVITVGPGTARNRL
jgi:hypothetical protein